MNMLKDISIDLAASFLYFLIALCVAYVIRQLRCCSRMRLISPLFSDKHVAVMLSIREGPFTRSTPRVSLAEIDAIVNLRSVTGNKAQFELLSNTDNLKVLENWNILLLGGPSANTASAEALGRLKKQIPFIFDADSRCITIANRKYTPVYSDDGTTVLRDYAVIVKAKNIFSESSKDTKLFLLMGLHGYGTRGAALALVDSAISKAIWRKVKTNNFSAVISVDIDNCHISVTLEEVWGM